MTSHRVGIMGLGMAAHKHALALADLSDRAEVAACWSPSQERRAAFAAQYNLPVCETLEAILGDPGIDLVLILTPPWTHLDLARSCVAAGKHVLLEKPIDATAERSRELVRLFDGTGLKLGVVFQNRFRTPHRRLRELLHEGALGAPISVSLAVRWWRPPSYFAELGRGIKSRDGGGVLLTQAIHAMDQMIDLIGAPDAVSGYAATSQLRQIDTEDAAAAALRWHNGCVGVLDATTTSYPGAGERIEIAATRGSAILERERLRVWWHDGTTEDLAENHADPAVQNDSLAHRRLIADMFDAIDNGREPGASGDSSLAVHALIEAVMRN